MNDKMKIICYARPWNASQFEEIAKGIDAKAEIQLLSEHFKVDQTGVSKRYYSALEDNVFINQNAFVGNDRDIILRCRLLRKLERIEALRHLYAMRIAIHEFMESFNPDVVLSLTIDSFVIDCLYEYTQSKSITFIGLVPSFINGYFRVTARGEHVYLREPCRSEVDQVLSSLDNQNYQPSFLVSSKKSPFKSFIKRWASNAIKPAFFFLKRYFSGEKYNYHYWASEKVSWEWFCFKPVFNLGDEHWQECIKKNGKTNIYIPLQMIPEATVDYWCDNLNAVEYENTLYETIFKLSKDFNFIIKEHPNVLGWRHPTLYKNLKSLQGVVFCPTDTPSNQIVEFCDAVFVWTGSVGVEAALRGKPVFALCHAYYVHSRMFKIVNTSTTSDEMLAFISAQSLPLSEKEKQSLINHVLSGLLVGKFKNNGSWSSRNQDDIKDAEKIGKSVFQMLGGVKVSSSHKVD